MSECIFRAVGLTKKFRKMNALDNLDLELVPGQVTVLLGPNGAGKTTLMRLALGALKPNRGSMRIFGMNPMKQPREVRQAVGFVPSIPDVYDWMNLLDLCRFLRPQYPTWNNAYAFDVVKALSVPWKVPFKAMSRGQAMKAMLVAALAPEPDLLLLDEPFAGLDPLAREEVLRGVLGQIQTEGRTVLCATHDLEMASRIADRIAILAQGKLKEEGTLEDVLGVREPVRVPEKILDLLHESVEMEGVPG